MTYADEEERFAGPKEALKEAAVLSLLALLAQKYKY